MNMELNMKENHSLDCYPGTNVLKNKLDIKDNKRLEELENALVVFKIYSLRKQGITGDFSKEHLQSIHKYLLEDLYYFAGEFRKENIAKDDFRFADARYIEQELDKIEESLKKENYLYGLDKESLSKRLAYYLAELNVIHPFREGNGRTTREYIRQLALKNGYLLDLRKVNFKEILTASIESVIDTKHLEEVIYKCLTKNIEETE